MASDGPGFGKSVLAGAGGGLLVVAAAVVAFALLPGLLSRAPDRVERFVLVVAGPGEDGVTAARVIVEVNAEPDPAMLSAVDPQEKATIEGTTYDRISDAYAFGGGAGVVEAAYGSSIPYVALQVEAFDSIVDAAGGMTVDVPQDMEVFTGGELLTFRKGPATLGGTEVMWLLEGARYLDATTRETLRDHVAEETVRLISSAKGGIAGLVERGDAESDADPQALPAQPLR